MTNFSSRLPARWLVALLTLLAAAGPALAQTVTLPTVTTVAPATSTIAEDQAPLGGNVTSDGGAPASTLSAGVVYSLNNGSLPTLNMSGSTPVYISSGAGSYSRLVSGLTASVTYAFRAFATNGAGTSYGEVRYFATRPVTPSVTVQSSMGAGNPNVSASTTSSTPTYIAVVGNSSYGKDNVTVFVAPTGGSATPLSASITSGFGYPLNSYVAMQSTPLVDGTYRVYATATNNWSVAGGTSGTITSTPQPTDYKTFTVDGTAPTITSITSTAIASGGTVNSTAAIPFTVNFSEKVVLTTTTTVTATNGTVSAINLNSNSTTLTFSVTPTAAGSITLTFPAGAIRDLVANPNAATSPFNFIYAAPVAPTVTTDTPVPATVLETSALLGGTVTGDGGAAVTERGIVFGTSGVPTIGNSAKYSASTTGPGSYTVGVSFLTPGTAYVFRAYAINSAGTSYGNTLIFATTPNPPTVTLNNFGTVLNTRTPTYFASPNGNATAVTFYVGTTLANATAIGSSTGAGFGLVQPTPLADGTYVVFATATAGSSPASGRSNIVPFTVDAAPTTTISSTAGATGSSTSSSPLPFTVTFSESVTGFAANKITVSNGTVTSGSFSGSGTTYTFTVTPTTAGIATGVGVATGAAQDAGGQANVAAPTYSLTYTAAVTSTTWTGNTTTDWFTASNWSPTQVPDATIDAVIPTAPSGGRFPSITAPTTQAQARNLTLNSGATLTMTNGSLAVAANLTNNGTFQPTGGTVMLGNSALSNILGSGTTRFWNLTVGASGAQQSTSASTSVRQLLTLDGSFTTNGNPFTLESNATTTALVINNGNSVVNGTATVQRYIVPDLNPNLGYRHVSAPITTATIGSLAISGGYSPVVNPDYNTSAQPGTVTPFPTVYGYDQSRLATTTNNLAAFDKGWFSPSATTDALTPGKSYTALAAANQTWSFTGTLGNGTLTQTLVRNSGATAADAGLHLVGNPYPAPLDLSQVAASDRTNLDQFVAMWVSNNPANPYAGFYVYYNNGLGTAGPVVALGQGFFTRVTPGQTAGTLTFRNSQRVTSYQNPTYHRTAETRPVVQLGLQATGSAQVDNAFVYFEQGATAAFDSRFDAPKLANPSGLNLSSIFAGSERLAINGLSPLGTSQVVVPLQVGVPAAGSYTLAATQLLNLSTTPTYLRDLQTGAMVDLAQQPSYQFTVSNASALLTGRFELLFSPQQPLATAPAALAQQVGLYPNPAKTTAFLELPASLGRQAVTATLVDALGRVVRTVTLPAQGAQAHQLDLHELTTGVYALRLSTSAGTIVKRLTVE